MVERVCLPARLLVLMVAATCSAYGEDWPTFLHDNQRTGVTGETLRPPLALEWVFESPFPPAKGWALPVNGYGARKNKPNVAYDDAFRVIAVGDTCYFSSSAENKVYAIDAAAGKIRWTFFTEAAPRLAPAYWQGRLYVGADDGIFRCLRANDGRLLWQVRAAPRHDLMLGQGRFSSLWPIRAAGMVDEGTVYFTAGLFPQNHVDLYAVSAADGALLWRRQLDRGGMGGYVPQGYILGTDDSLFLTSRVAPSRWSKRDGSRIDFNTPFPEVKDAHEYRFYNGGTYAQIRQGRQIVYGRACILAYDPDQVLKDKWGRPRKGALVFNWFNARQVLFRGEMAYFATDDHVLAVGQGLLAEMANGPCREFEEAYKRLRIAGYLDLLDERERLVEQHGEDHEKVRELDNGPLRWGRESWEQWPAVSEAIFTRMKRRCAWMTPLKATEALILAGDVIYAGGEEGLWAIDASDGKPLWSFATGSRVRGLAVANGRLYASTIDGKVRCFAATPPQGDPITVSPVRQTAPYREGDPDSYEARTARQIVDQAGTRAGYCLILGSGDGALAAEIAKITDFYIEVLEPDAEEAAEARAGLAAAGLYGGRVCVRATASAELPYPPYLFNLVIDQGSFLKGEPSAPVSEVFRVTKPHGGTAFLGKPGGAPGAPPDAAGLAPELKALETENAVPERVGRLWKITRGRVPGSRDWTHNYATAANTYCSEDPTVHGPFGVLWYGEPGPRKRIDRHATPPMPLVSGGILFTIGQDLVMAYDVYNGVPYWEREIRGATRTHLPVNTSNLAADERSLFVVVGDQECLRLAAGTGETIQTYSVPSESGAEPAAWAWIARDGDFLHGSRAEVDPSSRRPDPQKSGAVFALDVPSGGLAWTYRGRGIDHDGIAIGAGNVYLIDSGLTDAERDEALASTIRDRSVPDRPAVDRRGNALEPDLRKLVVLDAASGEKLWQKPLNVTDVTLDDTVVQGRGGVACMVHDGVIVVHGTGSLGHPHREFLAGKFARRALYAFDAATGRYLWGGRKGYRKRPILVGDYVYAEPFAWHWKTGAVKTVANPLSGRQQRLDFHRGYIGCGHVLASGTTLFGARGGIACYNLDDPCGFTPFAGMALACGLGATPAGGVLVVPEGRSGCTCDTPIYTSIALYPKREGGAWGTGFAGGCAETAPMPVEHVSVNLGAPGYRRDGDGNLWIPYPARVDAGSLGGWLPTYQHDDTMSYQLDELHATIRGTDTPWVFTSGYAHHKPLRFPMVEGGAAPARYTVRLYFAEPEEIPPGGRRFSVYLQGKRVLEDFDVAEAAGGPRRALTKEFADVEVDGDLEIRLEPSPGAAVDKPVLCGFQAFRQ